MRRNDLVLGIVLVVAVIGAGLIAQELHSRQQSITANSQDRVRRLPLAGFQKFMADVVWMRFLCYAGSTALTAESVDSYDHYIKLITSLDPEFFRAYHYGALLLGPIAPEKALAIVDAAGEHPRLKQRWELPMLAGQLLVGTEWQNYYAGRELDPKKLARAVGYFGKARNTPNHRQTATSSYIRTQALHKSISNKTPLELAELLEWRDHWQSSRFEMTGMPFLPMMRPPSEKTGADSPDGAGRPPMGYGYFSLDVEQRILSLIRRITKSYVQDPKATDAERTAAETLIKETIAKVFPTTKFDVESYIPYQLENLGYYRGTVAAPAARTFVVDLDVASRFAIKELTAKCATGTVQVTVLINGQPVSGLEKIAVATERQTFPARRANKADSRQTIEFQFAEGETATDFAYVLTLYLGDYF